MLGSESMAEPSYEEIRKQRLAEQADTTRSKILEAAARVLSREGFHGSTIRSIAREAGYTASSLYTYFPNKEAIFEALREWLVERGCRAFEAPVPASLSLEQKLEIITERILHLTSEMHGAALPHIVVKSQLPDETFEDHLDWSRVFMSRIVDWMGANARADELNGHSAEDVAHVYVAMVQAMVTRAALSGDPTRQRLQTFLGQALEYTKAVLARPAAG